MSRIKNFMGTFIYCQPLHRLFIWILLIALVWGWLYLYFEKNKNRIIWNILSALLLGVSLFGIWYFTINGRTEVETTTIVLKPFESFKLAREQPEYYRSMFMNMFLFYPLGMSLYTLFFKFSFGRLVATTVLGSLLSLAVESLQYHWSIGIFEVDDIIMNTLGTLFGYLAVSFACFIIQKGAFVRGRKEHSSAN